MRKAGGSPLDYVKIDADRSARDGREHGGSAGEDLLSESVTLNFAKFKFSYQPQDAKGAKKGGAVEATTTSQRTLQRPGRRGMLHGWASSPSRQRVTAEEAVKAGQLDEALGVAAAGACTSGGCATAGIFIPAVVRRGEWNRALTQLNVAGELDAGTLLMVQTYREALRCEVFRAEVFAGRARQWIR